jgi:GT2 family glycosyltransferase
MVAPYQDLASCIAVVPTFNRRELLGECLAALEAQTLPPAETLVVDNGSDDGTPEMIADRFPNVSYLRLPENTGSSGGYATGIDDARTRGHEWIWVMDDDAEPAPDCLASLIDASKKLPDAALLAPLVVGKDGHVQRIQRGFYSPVIQRQVPVHSTKKIIPIGYCSFCGPMIRADVLDRVDLPRRDFFIWFEDVEYTLRIGREGPMYLVTEARILHSNETSGQRNYQIPIGEYYKFYYGVRNRLLLLRTHEPSRTRRALGYLVSLYRVSRTALSLVAFRPPATRLRIRLLAWGVADGLKGRSGMRIDPARWRRETS